MTRDLSNVRTPAVLGLLVVGAVAFAHWPALSAGAISLDDWHYLFENPVLQQPSWASAGVVLGEVLKSSTVQGYYEPLTLLSLMLDVAAGGRPDNLRPFHVTSLVLHLFNTLLIVVLLYMLFGRPWVAAGVGLLFGVHPLTVEPVVWVWERKTLLAAFFALWCLIFYVRHVRRPGLPIYAGALVLFVLALLAKPTVTPLPVLLLLLDFWPLGRLGRRAVLEKVPFLVIAGISAIITVVSTAQNASVALMGEHSLAQLPLKVSYLLVFYFCKIVWPVNLSSIYVLPQPMTLSQPMVLGAAAVTCVLILLVVLLRRTRAPVMAGLFFITAMSPTLGVVQYSWVAASDKYVYIPAIGLLTALAWLLNRLAGDPAEARPAWRPAAVGIGIVAGASLLTIGTRQYLREWQTTERHEFYMLRLAPDSPYTHSGCGIALQASGRHDLSISYYTRAIELKPDFAKVYYNRGTAYSELRDYARAIEDYTRAIRIDPDLSAAYNNRGIVHHELGDYTRAIEDYTRAIELDPHLEEAYSNRGKAWRVLGNYDHAIADYGKSIELKPDDADTYNIRGIAYRDTGDYDRAIADFNKAIELKPDFAEAYYNRGTIYHGLQDYDRAIADFSRTISLKPDFAEAYINRGVAYGDTRDYNRAILDYNRAIELKPEDPDAYNNRAVSHYWLGQYAQARADLEKCGRLGGQANPDFIKALSQASSQPG
ncbi:MAG TPA: tetratricopeptide repeat protein [Phycisphaerae bacterium]|nr:tetratricopeptide repeat protein [Phycisphaerae bacterium]